MNDTNRNPKATVLMVLAGVLGAALAFQAFAQLGGPTGSRSGMISQVSGYTIMTSDAGNDDIVVVLDNRNEELMVYRSEAQGMQLWSKVPLPRLFTEARARNQGRN